MMTVEYICKTPCCGSAHHHLSLLRLVGGECLRRLCWRITRSA